MAESIDTIAQLLNKAENTDSPEEAALFMKAAERKAARMSLKLADLRAHTKEKQDQQGKPIMRRVGTGQKGMIRRPRIAELLWRLGQEYDIQSVAANDGSYVKLVGFESDIEMVETLYGHLLYQMVDEGKEFLRSDAFKESGLSRRDGLDNFYNGFILTVARRVGEQRRIALEQYEKRRSQDLNSMALVLKDKRSEVSSKYRDEFGRIRSLKRDNSPYNGRAYGAGNSRGREANIVGRKGVDTGKGKLA